jgi:uncharacterized membrane protein YfcA
LPDIAPNEYPALINSQDGFHEGRAMSKRALISNLYKRVCTRLSLCALITVTVWGVWLANMGIAGAIQRLQEDWAVTLTMVFGSFVAGVSSEGGGAVAFPVFTKILLVPPSDARLFSLCIQSVGMVSASLVILILGVRVEWRAIVWGSIGGVFGIAIGMLFISPWALPATTKMLFSALQASFAFTLLAKFRNSHRQPEVVHSGPTPHIILLLAGFLGGIASGLLGVGIDLVVFSVLVLLFKINEKVATPTSVILMAVNSLVGVILYQALIGPLPPRVVQMWSAAVPVVVVGAPVGAWVCSRLSRTTIAAMLIGLITLEVASSLLLLPFDFVVYAFAVPVGIALTALNFFMARCNAFAVEPNIATVSS